MPDYSQPKHKLNNPENIAYLLASKVSPSEGDAEVQPYNNEIEFLIKQQFASSLEQNRKERVKYSRFTFGLTVFWITLVIIIVFFSGFTWNKERILIISDNVLIALITTTTVNVFGFFVLVMQFLFNKAEITALSFLFNSDKTSTPKRRNTKTAVEAGEDKK